MAKAARQFNIRMPDDLRARIEDAARREDRTVSDMTRIALWRYFRSADALSGERQLSPAKQP